MYGLTIPITYTTIFEDLYNVYLGKSLPPKTSLLTDSKNTAKTPPITPEILRKRNFLEAEDKDVSGRESGEGYMDEKSAPAPSPAPEPEHKKRTREDSGDPEVEVHLEFPLASLLAPYGDDKEPKPKKRKLDNGI